MSDAAYWKRVAEAAEAAYSVAHSEGFEDSRKHIVELEETISALEAENARLREALEVIAKEPCEDWERKETDAATFCFGYPAGTWCLTCRARAALAKEGEK